MPDMQESFSTGPMHVSSLAIRPLLDISPDALIIINQAGIIVMANGQAEIVFGYSQEELMGQPLELLLPQRFRRIHTIHRERYFASPRTRPMGIGLQLVGLRKDGIEFPVEISLSTLTLDGLPHAVGAIRDMTLQHVAEQERHQQLQQIHLQSELINQSHDAILVRNPINRVISWNRGAEELYGWTAQEALGRVSHTLLKTRSSTSLADIEEHLDRTGRWEGQLTHTRKDGAFVLVESRQVLVRDEAGKPTAILEINRDITERNLFEQLEQAAHTETTERLTFLQEVLDALPSSMYLVSGPDARLLLANRAADRVWGAHWQENQPMLDFLASNGIEILDAQGRPLPMSSFATLRAVQHGETVLQHQETIRHPNGSSLSVLVNALPLTASDSLHSPQSSSEQQTEGQEPIALVMHQDVTALKEAEYLKDEFVGIAAHELRTPVTAVAGYADMLMVQTARGHGPELADWQQEALEEIKSAVARLVTLIEDLLDVTRLQAGRLHLQRTPVNMIPLVGRVASTLQQTTTRHQIEVHSKSSELVANLDPRRMEQVITNLITNAIKYSPQGGPIIISIEEESLSQTVCLSVQDKGIGIPRRQHGQIFGRFMRAENAQAWGISGTGLGLYLCRELVEWHGGRLWFESEEDAGSTFYVTLPLVSAHQDEPKVAS